MSDAAPPRTAGPGPRTAGEMLTLARDFLARKGLPEARLEAELLVAHALGRDRLGLFLALDEPVERAEVDRARELLVRRAAREPVAYLTGRREFYGRPFQVGPGVLVPRPETELLVDRARAWCDRGPAAELSGWPAVGDFGTGSGCLAVTLALELPGARVVAVDVSPEALEYARSNADALGAAVELLQGDDVAPLRRAHPGGLDLLVSNPPYVDPRERDALDPDVRDHEPAVALFAPPGDGEHWVRRLLDEGLALLRPGGLLLVELGAGQAPRVRALLAERGLRGELHRDLGGVERVLAVERDPQEPAKPASSSRSASSSSLKKTATS